MNEKLNIGIILGSTRQGRVSPQVGEWVLKHAESRSNASYEIVDIKDYNLPLLGEEESDGILKWNQTLEGFDGFIFVVAEYNHAMTGALKNALDLARDAWHNKVAGIVSYGSGYGIRAAEQLRVVLAELEIADVRSHVQLSLFHDFKEGVFTPLNVHQANLTNLYNQVETWGKALKSIR